MVLSLITKGSLSFCLAVMPLMSLAAVQNPINQANNHNNRPVEDKKLDRLFVSLKEMQKRDLIDGEVLIAKGDKVLLHLESNDVQSANYMQPPQFMIGSVSKQFFAVALLKSLYQTSKAKGEAAKIADVKSKLRQPLSTFLPSNAPIWDNQMPKWANVVTLHQLLSHTSGVPNYAESEGFGLGEDDQSPKKRFYESNHSAKEVFQLISKSSLLFQPGQSFAYSNTGYLIIAEVLEAITKTPADVYLKKEIFDPLELTFTDNPTKGGWEQLKKSICPTLAKQGSYNPAQINSVYPLRHQEDLSVAKGAASIVSTGEDLLKWNLALHKNGTVLPKGLYKLLVTENLDGYGYGIEIGHTSLGVAYRHHGEIGTYRTIVCYLPEQDLSIIVLSHISYDWDKVENEFQSIASSLNGKVPPEATADVARGIIHNKYPGRGYARIEGMLMDVFHG